MLMGCMMQVSMKHMLLKLIKPIHNGINAIFFSRSVIDQSGNNVLIDELNPQNIIRIDITNSQSGT